MSDQQELKYKQQERKRKQYLREQEEEEEEEEKEQQQNGKEKEKENNEEKKENHAKKEFLVSRKKYNIKESIENMILQNNKDKKHSINEDGMEVDEKKEEEEEEEERDLSQSPSQDFYYKYYFSKNNDDNIDDDNYNNMFNENYNKFINLMHIVCICLIILFIFKITFLCYYHSPIIKYTFITFILLILIYPVITDFIYMHMYLIQNYSYNSIKKFGYYIKDQCIYNNNNNDNNIPTQSTEKKSQ